MILENLKKRDWKFNNSLLREVYIEKVKNVISEIKRQYASTFNTVENLEDINEIPAQDLTLNINEQLFFETLLMNIW